MFISQITTIKKGPRAADDEVISRWRNGLKVLVGGSPRGIATRHGIQLESDELGLVSSSHNVEFFPLLNKLLPHLCIHSSHVSKLLAPKTGLPPKV